MHEKWYRIVDDSRYKTFHRCRQTSPSIARNKRAAAAAVSLACARERAGLCFSRSFFLSYTHIHKHNTHTHTRAVLNLKLFGLVSLSFLPSLSLTSTDLVARCASPRQTVRRIVGEATQGNQFRRSRRRLIASAIDRDHWVSRFAVAPTSDANLPPLSRLEVFDVNARRSSSTHSASTRTSTRCFRGFFFPSSLKVTTPR